MELLPNNYAKILSVSTRTVNTKNGPKSIKVLTLEGFPIKAEIWNDNPVFDSIDEGKFLVVKSGLLYEKSNGDFDPTLVPKKDSEFEIVSEAPLRSKARPAAPQIPKTIETGIQTPIQTNIALITIMDEIRNELRQLRVVLEQKLDFKQPKLDDVVSGE